MPGASGPAGPMYTMRKAVFPPVAGRFAGFSSPLSTASGLFGIGNMTQSHSIAQAPGQRFPHLSPADWHCGDGAGSFAVLGGIRSVSRISTVLVPAMALFYLAAGLAVIWGNRPPCPGRWLISSPWPSLPRPPPEARRFCRCRMVPVRPLRHLPGCFSNEAGMGPPPSCGRLRLRPTLCSRATSA